MSRWKKMLLGAALVLALIATGASGSLSGPVEGIDVFDALVQPPVCAETGDLLADTTVANDWDCGCWFYHMGVWWCYPCP